MIERLPQVKHAVALLAVAAGLVLRPAPGPAEPAFTPRDGLVAQLVCEYLQRGHLTQPRFDDEVSRRLFRRFLEDLDPGKLYFLESDIDEFKKQDTQLDQLLEGDLRFASRVHDRLVKRVGERLELVEEFVG